MCLFQLLLLGSDMCPTMTSLILGEIVLFNEEFKKVAMKIPSAFMEPIGEYRKIREESFIGLMSY